MTGKILVVTALPDELDRHRAPDGVEVIYCGVGKINTTLATLEAIQRVAPDIVVNYGTAGRINPARHGLIEIAHVIQRDMMAMPLAPRGRTPFAPELDRLSSGHGDAICGTGDSFVSAADPWLAENRVDVVDMELFALAQTCLRHDTPWRAYKFITDDANELAADHWNENVASGEELFWNALRRDLMGG